MKKLIHSRYTGRTGIFRCLFFAAALLLFSTCKPKIYEFHVEPLTIWPTDSVKVTWKARGEAVLMVNDRKAGKDTSYRVFTLGFPGQEGGQQQGAEGEGERQPVAQPQARRTEREPGHQIRSGACTRGPGR